jgi:tRNA (cmo5U34)-methyltransferase
MTDDFSFAAHAREFDEHIGPSVPGFERLCAMRIGYSRRFIQSGTMVVDIGCSTGAMLRSIRDENEPSRPSVRYLGIDTVSKFDEHWCELRTNNVRFEVCDARSFVFENMCLVYSIFTLQFISERDRLSLLRRVYDGLNEGGTLFIAEKVLANSAKTQDILTFSYYDFKRQSFSAEEILDKERSLRGQMILWDEERWENTLCEVGFQIQRIWQDGPFIAWLAMKSTSQPSAEIVPTGQSDGTNPDKPLRCDPAMESEDYRLCTGSRYGRNEIIFIQDQTLDPLLASEKRDRLISGRDTTSPAAVRPKRSCPRR